MKSKTHFKKYIPALVAFTLGAACLVGAVYADPRHTNAKDWITATDAIQTAKKSVNAEPIEVELEYEMNEPRYEVTMIQEDSKVFEVVVHARTGDVILTQNIPYDRDDEREDRFENTQWYTAVHQGKYLTLEQAISKVDMPIGTRIISVDIDQELGQPVYEIEMRTPMGVKQEVTLSAAE